MSYQVLHFQKFSKSSLGGIEIHNERKKDGISHTNPDIDWERTNQNYDLHQQPTTKTYFQMVKHRVEELNLPKAVRKDAVLLCGFVVSSDQSFFKGLSKEQQEQFFKDSYNFFADRYGKENIISAKVHLDETTPHMHLYTVPVTADGRLSAKSIFNRRELISLHDEFNKQVGKEFGLQRGEPIEQGKRRTHFQTAEFKEYTQALEEASHEEQKALESVSKAQERVQGIQDSMKPLQAEYEACKAYVKECDKASQISISLPDYAKVKKSLFGKESVTVPKEKWEQKHISANEKSYLQRATDEFEKAVVEFRKTSSAEHLAELEQKINVLERSVGGLQKENYSLKNKLVSVEKETDEVMDKINRVLGELPKSIASEFIKAWKENERQQSYDWDMER